MRIRKGVVAQRALVVLVIILCVVLNPGRPEAGGGRAGMEPDRVITYKEVDDAELKLHVFLPEGHSKEDERPAIVFFFGGGWRSGHPRQFFPQSEYLTRRGMVAISAEYRVRSRHGVTPYECVTDAKSAVRWVRKHADELGVAPKLIAAGGGSAGGHVAACTGVVEGLEQEGEDTDVSSRPNALVLFNPALYLPKTSELAKRIGPRLDGRDPERISPYHHVDKNEPPTIIFHGTADTTVPIETVRKFRDAMKGAGNRCKLVEYEDQGHGFFNYGRGDGKPFTDTMREADEFLRSLGYLEGEPTIDEFP